jgi:peptide deformylase
MKIIQAPNVLLAKQAKKINKIDKDILTLIEDMKKTLLTASDPEGVGLAAPQVGKSLQLFLVKVDNDTPFHIFINPEVTLVEQKILPSKKLATKKPTRLEGCLSLKDIWGTVHRATKVRVKYLDEKGKLHDKVFNGFSATIIQHEQDHLHGILFPKRVLEQKGKLYKSHKDEHGEDVFDPLKLA